MTIAKLVAGSAASFLLAVLTPPSLPDDLGMLLPGDRTLIPSGLTAGDSSQQHFFRIDSTGAERAGGGEHVTLIRPVAGDPSRLLLIWQLRSPRGEMADTMRVRMPGLIPEWERLVTPQGTNTYEYDGGTVRSRLVRGDSAPVVKEQRYPQPVFGFNELDALIRSIPYAPGYTRVVPLYSEGDNDIEYDTLTVLGRAAGGSEAAPQ